MDQLHRLCNTVHQMLGRVVKQQMRLIKEEHELRFVRGTRFRQLLQKLRHLPIKSFPVMQSVRVLRVSP